MVLVDGSTSISPDNFQIVLSFIARLVGHIDIGPDKVQIGGFLVYMNAYTFWMIFQYDSQRVLC